METSVRRLTRAEVNYTQEAWSIQNTALAGGCRVVKLNQIVFFATETGDAWMLDPADALAACLARGHVNRPLPIWETGTKLRVKWNLEYRIDGESFSVREQDGGATETIIGYPTREIERMIREYPAEPKEKIAELFSVLERFEKTGRNDPCPCGSGRKYKKCCLARDEARVHQNAADREMNGVTRAEAAPSLVEEAEAEFPGAAPEILDDGKVETEQQEEWEVKLDQAWVEFDSLSDPTTEQMNGFLGQLLEQPFDATEWGEVLHRFARGKHADLPGVYRRISAGVRRNQGKGSGFFYWAAMEVFTGQGLDQLLPEVAADYQQIDGQSYDPEALDPVEFYLIAGGFDAQALKLAEHFLPIERANKELMPGVVAGDCGLIFELRVGESLRAGMFPGTSPQALAESLHRGLEDEIDADSARAAAEIVCGRAPPLGWTRPEFALVAGDISTSEFAWHESLRLHGTLIRVAQEAWQLEKQPPGGALRGLSLLLDSVYQSKGSRPKKSKRKGGNLLDLLNPAGLESRIARSCGGLVHVSEPCARLQIQTYALLSRCALRHGLISAVDADCLERELTRLRRPLTEAS
jgi:hypothetical protein